MAVSKVIYAGKTLIDLTADTVTADTLAKGATAHDMSGNKIVGTMTGGGSGDLVDVTELPEAPAEGKIYRTKMTVLEGTEVYTVMEGVTRTLAASFVALGAPTPVIYHEVDELPTGIGEFDGVSLHVYIIKSENMAYVNTQALGAEDSTWITLTELATIIEQPMEYQGVVTSKSEAVNDGWYIQYGVEKEYTIIAAENENGDKDFYSYSDGKYISLGGRGKEAGSYKLYLCAGISSIVPFEAFAVALGGVYREYVCDELPDSPVDSDVFGVYFCKNAGYTPYMFRNGSWQVYSSSDTPYLGLVNSTSEMTQTGVYVLHTEQKQIIADDDVTVYREKNGVKYELLDLVPQNVKIDVANYLASSDTDFTKGADVGKYIQSISIVNSKWADTQIITENGSYVNEGCGDIEVNIEGADTVRQLIEGGLQSITIPSSIRTIRTGAFAGLSILTTVEFADGIWHKMTAIGDAAFYQCTRLSFITLPERLISIGALAFFDCNALTSINLPLGLKIIGDSAFEGSGLESAIIPDSITTIGASVFRGCSLRNVTIPVSVTEIGNEAFYACTALGDIYYGGTKIQWQSITKGTDWKEASYAFTVHCTDGDITNEDA